MKHKHILLQLVVFLAATLAVSCSHKESERKNLTYDSPAPTITIGGINFNRVEATSFAFNETLNGRLIDGAPNSFENVQSSFYISERPLDKAFYEMFAGKGRYPKNGLCTNDVDAILDKVYEKIKTPVIISTESMLEAAYKTEAIKLDKINDVVVADGWQSSRSAQGLTEDWYVVPSGPQVVLRSLFERNPIEDYHRRTANQFYLAIRTNEPLSLDLTTGLRHSYVTEPEPSDGQVEVFYVEGASFRMIPVKGGQMTLGATPEQERYAEKDEAPLREVELKDFKICETEVTIGLWLAVMDELPIGNDRRDVNKPVGNVSFYRAQEFIRRLNDLTERQFRLPSEDEWEYAARGGQKSHGYIFAGGNNAQDVAVCSYKAKKKDEVVRPGAPRVKSRRPNELGLYDMSGSQWEWVTGEMPDGQAIQKGGSWKSLNTACRVSNRQAMGPGEKKDTFGFRIAL